MVRYLILFICIIVPNFLFSQRVGSYPATIGLSNFNDYTNDGTLTFQIDCRMADCIYYVEINDLDKIKKKKNIWDKIRYIWWFKILKRYDFEVSHTFKKIINEENYFLEEQNDDREQIMMKCELISLKSLFNRKKLKRKLQINIVSKSGKTIYSKIFTLDKTKLLEKMEVRLGVEPS